MSNANPKTRSTTKAMIPATLQRPGLFGRPPLLTGEDPAAYDELFAGIRAAVNPIDTVADVVALQWEVLRWRRLESLWCAGVSVTRWKEFCMTSLVPMCTRKTLCTIWRAPLRTIFRETKQKQLARAYARNDPDAEDKVEKIFENASTFLAIDTIVKRARAGKAEELAEKYVRRDPDAIKLVDEVLAGASVNIDDFTAKKVADRFAHRANRIA